MDGLRILTTVSVLAAVSACGSSNAPSASEPPGLPPPFAAFRLPSMVIDRLESAVEPPYVAGSTKSGSLLTSSDPAIVGIDAAGNLIGHRNGEAVVRARGGSSLKVLVQSAKSIAIVPSRIELQPGATRDIEVTAGDQKISAQALRWQTSDAGIAVGFGLTIQGGLTPGTATLTASLGEASATVNVVVQPMASPMKVEPARARVSPGAVQQLKVASFYAATAKWTSSNPSVLQHLHDGLYLAKGYGSASACAIRGLVQSCAKIDVVH